MNRRAPAGGLTLAAAVALSAAVMAVLPGAAAADPGDPVDPGSDRAVAGRAAAAPGRATRIASGTAVRTSARPGSPGPARRAAAVANASGGGLASVFANQTPALSPTQGTQSGNRVSGQINAVDADADALSYSVSVSPSHGSVVIDSAGRYTYTADAAVAATGISDSFQVSVSDAAAGFHVHGLLGLINLITFGLIGSSGHVATATVRVNVAPFGAANRAPTGTASAGSPDPVTGVVAGAVLGSDPDGDALSYSGSGATTKGSVVVGATGSFVYTPTDAARQTAAGPTATTADRQDAFTVTISDGRGGTAAVGVTVAVAPATTPAPGTGLAAFPGAEGFGGYATGGRDGSVIYVTNLNANGPGSLQWAIDQPGARYILFKVSGLIDAQIHLTNGNVTIAGQTSPGGITIRGLVTDETPFQDQAVRAPTDFAENWILQHIRIRPVSDSVSDDGLRIRYTRNAIVDHVSIGNALDEAIEISYSHDITVQNTIIAETIGGHSQYGGVLMNYSNPAYGFKLDNISLHHDIFNRIEGRLPEGSRESLAAANSTMNLELSNNLYWDPNFFVALAPSTGVVTNSAGDPYPIYWKINAVNNFFQTRAGFPYGMFDDQIMRNPANQLFVSGNTMSLYPGRSDYQLFFCCNDYATLSSADLATVVGNQQAQKMGVRFPFPAVTYTPTDQLRTALLNTAGAWPRDPMDLRLLGSVAAGTIASAPRNTNPAGDALLPAFSGSAPAPPVDTDADGMPDSWEIARGLNPNVASPNARTLSTAGYTDLEIYLQELSASRITGWV